MKNWDPYTYGKKYVGVKKTSQVEDILAIKFPFPSELGKGHGYLIWGQTTLVQLTTSIFPGSMD